MHEELIRSYDACRVLGVSRVVLIYDTDAAISATPSLPIPSPEKVDEDKADHQGDSEATHSAADYSAHVPRRRVRASPTCSSAKE